MDRAMSALTAGLLSEVKKLDITSNNLANVNTPGFKRDEVFSDWMSVFLMNARSHPDPAARDALKLAGLLENREQDGTLVQARPILEAGPLQHTGDPLDVAIEGPGFFVLDRNGVPAYTRLGRFSLDAQGNLVSREGYAVLGVDGPLVIAPASPNEPIQVRIEEDGTVFNGAQRIGQFKIVQFSPEAQLGKLEGTSFVAGEEGEILFPAEAVGLRQGYVELSNVDVVKEMTEMISATRTFEAYQKSLQILDDLKGRLIQSLSR